MVHVEDVVTSSHGPWRKRLTIQDLDRLVSKTELTPTNKKALRAVRKMSITDVDPLVGKRSWSISVDSYEGQPMMLSFSFKVVS